MTSLVTYDIARKALQEAHSLDNVREVYNRAEAMRVYAKQINDIEMERWLAEIKIRARRRFGEMSKDIPKQKNQHDNCLSTGGQAKNAVLKGIGVSRQEANKECLI